MTIIIQSTNLTSRKDLEDLKILLEDISDRFHFKWHFEIDKLKGSKE